MNKSKLLYLILMVAEMTVKPIVKWLGGKRLLVPELRKRYPSDLGSTITAYVEPFVGGGAVLFDILSNYKLDNIFVSDANESLINMYNTVRSNPTELMHRLDLMQSEYIGRADKDRTVMYNEIRDCYNKLLKKGCSSQSINCAS